MLLPEGSLWGMNSLGEGLGILCSLFLGVHIPQVLMLLCSGAGAVGSCWDWGWPWWDGD